MKIYVDFDRTLFDCDTFLEDLYNLIGQYNIPKAIFRECQNQCMKQGFNPYTILNLVKEKYEFDDKLFNDTRLLINNSSKYLYNDAIPFLQYLKDKKYQITILTKGNEEYQKEKIHNSGINSYYDELIVTMSHKGDINIDYANSIFIDDNPTEIKSIVKRKPKKIIRICRYNSKYKDCVINIVVDTTISLQEIMDSQIL